MTTTPTPPERGPGDGRWKAVTLSGPLVKLWEPQRASPGTVLELSRELPLRNQVAQKIRSSPDRAG